MKCAHCKNHHGSLAEVKNCSAGDSTQCRHELPSGTCVCAWGKKISQMGLMRPIRADRDSWCFLCKEDIGVTQRIVTHWSLGGRWVHYSCMLHRAEFLPPVTGAWLDQDSLGDQEFQTWWSRLLRLTDAAEELHHEAITVERETSMALLRAVAEDMDWELDICLIQETLYGTEWELGDAEEEPAWAELDQMSS